MNLAVFLAKEGKNVCLLDNDFHGPSVMTFFSAHTTWINEYLYGKAKLESCLQNIAPDLGLAGKLFVGFADSTAESIQHVIRIDQNSSMKMLHYLMQMKRELKQDPYNIEYFIIDCSPGTGFSTINVMVVTESVLFVVKLSNADLIGTSQMIAGLQKQLKSRTALVANLVPDEFVNNEATKNKFQQLIEKNLTEHLGDKTVEFLGWIPTDSNLQSIEFETALKSLEGKKVARVIFSLDQPEHNFTKMMGQLVSNIFGEDT